MSLAALASLCTAVLQATMAHEEDGHLVRPARKQGALDDVYHYDRGHCIEAGINRAHGSSQDSTDNYAPDACTPAPKFSALNDLQQVRSAIPLLACTNM